MARHSIALASEPVRHAVGNATDILAGNRASALDQLTDADAVRDEAAWLRRSVIGDLAAVLRGWQVNAEAQGTQVHHARTAADAVAIVLRIAAESGSRPAAQAEGQYEGQAGKVAGLLVAKGKSMASEEIHLNEALEADGTRRWSRPTWASSSSSSPTKRRRTSSRPPSTSHATTWPSSSPPTPAHPIDARHRRRGRVRAGTRCGRRSSRPDIGITGVNFAVADTGSICLVENEGNGRMCSHLAPGPRRHHGHGAHRARLGRARRDAGAPRPVGDGAGAVGLHQHHHRAPPGSETRRAGRAARDRARQRPLATCSAPTTRTRCTASAAAPASTSAPSTARSAATPTTQYIAALSEQCSPHC